MTGRGYTDDELDELDGLVELVDDEQERRRAALAAEQAERRRQDAVIAARDRRRAAVMAAVAEDWAWRTRPGTGPYSIPAARATGPTGNTHLPVAGAGIRSARGKAIAARLRHRGRNG